MSQAALRGDWWSWDSKGLAPRLVLDQHPVHLLGTSRWLRNSRLWVQRLSRNLVVLGRALLQIAIVYSRQWILTISRNRRLEFVLGVLLVVVHQVRVRNVATWSGKLMGNLLLHGLLDEDCRTSHLLELFGLFDLVRSKSSLSILVGVVIGTLVRIDHSLGANPGS